MKIAIDTDTIGQLAVEGKEIVFKPEAEEALLQLLEMQESLEKAIDTAKVAIEKSALEYNENFTSVQGHKVKVGYRRYGSKYGIDPAKVDQLDPTLYKTESRYHAIPDAVDEWAEKNGALPLGVTKRDRAKQITMKRLEDWGDEE